ncbi:MAG: sodium/solute symporter [Candidatus Neomarinimicrobiota bacterium]
MNIDLLMVLLYFVGIFIFGVYKSARQKKDAEAYFLSGRKLRWPSIAMSTIATNIQAGHFIGMGGAAYAYGLAQANFEIGAVFGILLAAFFFVPLYLRLKVFTLAQFFQDRFGSFLALSYAIFSIVLFGIIYLGGALYWGSFAINGIFGEQLNILHPDPVMRLYILVVLMGLFSAGYVYFGGLAAVVRTDVIQMITLLGGSSIVLVLAIKTLGGLPELYNVDLYSGIQTGKDHLMHLFLPLDHEKIPWTAVFFGMLLMHIQYWGANQVILQRALAARSLKDAQLGLVVGGFLKYFVAALIIIPPIALVGFHESLEDPDRAYIVLVNTLLAPGIRGFVLMGLFASLMSTVDSIINSVGTMISIDVYKRLINKKATDKQLIRIGKNSTWLSTIAGILFAFALIHIKHGGLDFPLSHLTNEISYHIKAGFTILILAAVFCSHTPKKIVTTVFIASAGVSLAFRYLIFPDMNYLNRTGWVIVLCYGILAAVSHFSPGQKIRWKELITVDSRMVGYFGIVLALSLIGLNIVFR